jgi:hypothetical protein
MVSNRTCVAVRAGCILQRHIRQCAIIRAVAFHARIGVALEIKRRRIEPSAVFRSWGCNTSFAQEVGAIFGIGGIHIDIICQNGRCAGEYNVIRVVVFTNVRIGAQIDIVASFCRSDDTCAVEVAIV